MPRVDNDELLGEFDDLADAEAARLARVFREAFATVASQTDLDRLQAALRRGDLLGAVEAIPWAKLPPALLRAFDPNTTPALLRALDTGNGLGLRLIPGGGPPPPADPGRLYERAAAYLQRHGAAKVVEISDQTRGAMRDLLAGAYREPRSVSGTARSLREVLDAKQVNGLIGIRRAQVGPFLAKLQAWTDNPDLSAARIQLLANREHAKLVKQRCLTIAQTELYDAGNEGLVQVWEELRDDGQLVVRGLRQDFVSEPVELKDRAGNVRQEVYRAPRAPLHVKCYCSHRLKRIGSDVLGRPVYAVEWVTRVVGVCPKCEAMRRKLAGGERVAA